LSDIYLAIGKADIFLKADLNVFVAENGLKDFLVIPSWCSNSAIFFYLRPGKASRGLAFL